MDANARQAEEIKRRRLVSPVLLSIAQRELARQPGQDLCAVLLSFGHISAALADELRQSLGQSAPGPARPGSEDLAEDDLTSTLKLPSRGVTGKLARLEPAVLTAPPVENVKLPSPVESGRMKLDRFETIATIASGGLGMVLKARHRPTGKLTALKVLFKDGDDETRKRRLGRFHNEAKVLSKLEHPNIVRLIDYGEDQGDTFLAMELIEGRDLGRMVEEVRLRRCAPPPGQWTLEVIATIARALQYCHARGIVHRDVKPSNIIIENVSQRPVLVDFGLVKNDRSDEDSSIYALLSVNGEVVGTPAFMAPEQVDASGTFGEVDAKTDVWGLGATLFHMFTGEMPYKARTAQALMIALLTEDPRRLRDLRPAAPAWLDALIANCMQRDPKARYSIQDLLSALSRGPETVA